MLELALYYEGARAALTTICKPFEWVLAAQNILLDDHPKLIVDNIVLHLLGEQNINILLIVHMQTMMILTKKLVIKPIQKWQTRNMLVTMTTIFIHQQTLMGLTFHSNVTTRYHIQFQQRLFPIDCWFLDSYLLQILRQYKLHQLLHLLVTEFH